MPITVFLRSILTRLGERMAGVSGSFIPVKKKVGEVLARLNFFKPAKQSPSENLAGESASNPEASPKRKIISKKLVVSTLCGVGFAVVLWPVLSIIKPSSHAPLHAEKSTQLDFDAALKEATAAFAAGDFAKVCALLPNYLEKASPSAERSEAKYMLAEATDELRRRSADEGDLDELVALYRDAVAADDSNPKTPSFLHRLGALLSREQKYSEARTVLDRLIRDFPEYERSTEVLLEQGKTYLAEGTQLDVAERVFSRLLRDYPSSPVAPAAKLALADTFHKQGRKAEAANLYTKLVQESPNQEVVQEARTHQAEMGKTREAVQGGTGTASGASPQEFDSAARDDKALLAMARKQFDQGNFAQVRVLARRFIESFPQSAGLREAHILLAKALIAQDKLDEAIETTKADHEEFPDDSRFLEILGDVEFKQGSFESSLGHLSTALSLSSTPDPALYHKAGLAAWRAGKLDQARSLFKELIDKYPASTVAFDAHFQLADVLQEQGDVGMSFQLLNRQLSSYYASSQRVQVLKRMGKFYLSMGLTTKALDVLTKVTTEANDPEALYLMAKAHLLAEEPKEALAALQKADTEKLPQDLCCSVRLLLAQIQFRLGEIDSAERELDRADNNHSSPAALEAETLRFRVNLMRNELAKARKAYNDARELAQQSGGLPEFLAEAGTEWADYLYGRGDYAAALAVLEDLTNHLDQKNSASRCAWAAFQKANCHLNLREFDQAVAGYADFMKRFPSSEWAKLADTKKRYAELEAKKQVGTSA